MTTFSGKQLLRGGTAGMFAGIFLAVLNSIILSFLGAGLFAFFLLILFSVPFGITGLLVGAILSFFYDKIRIPNLALKSAAIALLLGLITVAITRFINFAYIIGEDIFLFEFLGFDTSRLIIYQFLPAFVTWFIFSLIFGFLWRAKKKNTKE